MATTTLQKCYPQVGTAWKQSYILQYLMGNIIFKLGKSFYILSTDMQPFQENIFA
jgi:hypothetical protein